MEQGKGMQQTGTWIVSFVHGSMGTYYYVGQVLKELWVGVLLCCSFQPIMIC